MPRTGRAFTWPPSGAAIADSLFRAQFGHEDTLLAARQYYLLTPDGEPVGTATAWFDDSFADGRWGRVR